MPQIRPQIRPLIRPHIRPQIRTQMRPQVRPSMKPFVTSEGSYCFNKRQHKTTMWLLRFATIILKLLVVIVPRSTDSTEDQNEELDDYENKEPDEDEDRRKNLPFPRAPLLLLPATNPR